MWAKVLGVACFGVFVGAFMVELARSGKTRGAEREPDLKRESEEQKRARKASVASA